MKAFKYIVLLIFILTVATAQSQNRKIEFQDKPWNDILQMAGATDKIIFMDAYATWCGPCKWIAANMFTNDTIADFYNEKFICVKFDMEKGEGLSLAAQYQVKAYPTLLFITSKGELVHKRVGAPQKVSDYIEMGKIALTPGQGLTEMQKRYDNGDRSPAFMISYLDRLQGAYVPITEQVNQYFASLPEQDRFEPLNWQILYKYVTEMNSPAFGFLQKNQAAFEKRYSPDSVYQKIFNVYLQSLAALVRTRNFSEANYSKAKQTIMESGFKDAGKVIFTADIYVSQMKGDFKQFTDLAMKDLDKFYRNDPDFLYQVAGTFLQVAEDPKQLEKATEWAQRASELRTSPDYLDTWAELLYKTGKKQEAVKAGEMALELAKKEKVATDRIESNLKKYRGQ